MKKHLLAFSLLVLPLVSSAQSDFTNVTALLTNLKILVNNILPFIFSLALLYFFWGLAKFVMGGGEDKEKGKNIMIWGIVALLIMASVWGIITYLQVAFGVGGGTAPTLPTVPTV